MSKKHKEPYLLFHKILGFFPNDISLYRQAMTHRSAGIKSQDGDYVNNERLEFLGDAVLSAVVADILYNYYSQQDEGFLTNTRSKIVQRETLNRVAIDMGLKELLVISPKNNIQKGNIYGNALEALIGAIYLDKGYKECFRFIKRIFESKHISIEKLIQKEINFKSRLVEFSQKYKMELTFELVQQRKTDDGQRMFFETEAVLNGIVISMGTGYSKKESQQNAAHAALRKLKKNNDLIERIKKNKISSAKESIEPILER